MSGRGAIDTGWLLAAAALAAGCGGGDLGQFRVALDPPPGADRIELRVFGPALTCEAFENGPALHRTVKACAVEEQETSAQCHLVMAVVTEGPVRLLPVPAGTRTLTGLGFAAQSLVSFGCTDGVAVVERQTVRARLALRAR